MKTCPTCEDAIKTRKVLRDKTGPLCSPLYKKKEFCAYCEWKGTTGPGKLLREIIAAERSNQ